MLVTLQNYTHAFWQTMEVVRVSLAELFNRIVHRPCLDTSFTCENKAAFERIKKGPLANCTANTVNEIWKKLYATNPDVQRLNLCRQTVLRKLNEERLKEVHYQGRALQPCRFEKDLFDHLPPSSSYIGEVKSRTFPLIKQGNRFKRLNESLIEVDEKAIYLKDPAHPSPDEIELLNLLKDKAALLELIHYWGEIISDPALFYGYLRKLDQDLAYGMKKENLAVPERLFDYIMEGKGIFVPGPRSKDLQPADKAEKLLRQTLLLREQSRGINQEGAPRFVNYIDRDIANDLVASGHVFEDDPLISRLLLHGAYSHRLQIEVLCQSLKNHPRFCRFPPKQILNLLLCVKKQPEYLFDNEISLWDYCLDSFIDVALHSDYSEKEHFYPRHFTTSCSCPNVFSANLLCFGKEMGLPHLQYLLLESFWNGADALVKKEQSNCKGTADQETLYAALLASHQDALLDVISQVPGSQTSKERRADPNFHSYPGNPDIDIVTLDPEAEPAYRLTKRMLLAKERKEIQVKLLENLSQKTEQLLKKVRAEVSMGYFSLLNEMEPIPQDFAKLYFFAVDGNKRELTRDLLNKCRFQDNELPGISVTHYALTHGKWEALKELLTDSKLLSVIDPKTKETVLERLSKIHNLDPEIQRLAGISADSLMST